MPGACRAHRVSSVGPPRDRATATPSSCPGLRLRLVLLLRPRYRPAASFPVASCPRQTNCGLSAVACRRCACLPPHCRVATTCRTCGCLLALPAVLPVVGPSTWDIGRQLGDQLYLRRTLAPPFLPAAKSKEQPVKRGQGIDAPLFSFAQTLPFTQTKRVGIPRTKLQAKSTQFCLGLTSTQTDIRANPPAEQLIKHAAALR